MSEIVEEFIEYEFDDEDGDVEVSSQEQEDGDVDEGGIEIVEELLENSNDGVVEEYLPTDEVQNEYIDDQTHIIMEEDVEEDFEDGPEEVGNIELQQDDEENPSPLPPSNKKARTIATVAGDNRDPEAINNRCEKMPRRFLLYDMLVAEIVDYDTEDGAPIVEFSMSTNERESKKLPVECGICPDVMPRSKLNAHIKTHLKPGTKRFNCIYCDENFVSRSYAAGHARRHMGIRPYVCAECKLYYCTKQDLKVHEQRRHLRKEHICEHCGKTFAQNTTLRSHVLLVHEQKRRFECEHCGKRFLRNYTKIKHIQNVHFGNRTLYDCPFCDKRFKDTHKLADHRKREHLSTQTLFECRECGLEFTSIDFFDAHRRSLQCRQKYKERYSHDTPTTIASATATIDSVTEENDNEESQDNIIEDNQHPEQIEETAPVQVHEYVVHEYEVPEGVDPDQLMHLQAGQRFVLATDETLKQEEEYLYEITVDS